MARTAAIVGLTAAGLVLLIATMATRRRPDAAPPDLHTYFVRWQIQHRAPDIDPTAPGLLHGFLVVTYRLALPLARAGVSPNLLTGWGLWLAGWVPVLASGRTFALVAAALLVVVSAVTDGVDGAVAALTDRATPAGFVLDSVADRIADGLMIGALFAVGGAPWAGVAAGCGVLALEYTRARAGNAGIGEVGIVTVGERPTRVIAVVFCLVGAAARRPSASAIATGSLVVIALASTVGLGQLARWLRANLRTG